MSNPVIRAVVRTMFVATGRARAASQAGQVLGRYMDLARSLSDQEGSRCVVVPPMRGIDEDMRRWSFFMVLEHNAIVNRSISAMVAQLARREPPAGPALIDPKTGVMPALAAGREQVAEFEASVLDHLRLVPTLGRLRGTRTSPHPVFGDFDAHKWNCMFAFHLGLHLPQAEHVARCAKSAADGDQL